MVFKKKSEICLLRHSASKYTREVLEGWETRETFLTARNARSINGEKAGIILGPG